MLKQNAPNIGIPFDDLKGAEAHIAATGRIGRPGGAQETRFPSVDKILNDINSAFEKRTSAA